MKLFVKIIFSFIFLLLIFTGCGKNEGIDFNNPETRIFVQQIKADRYATKGSSGKVEIPNFKKEDISALLIYAKDNTPIRNYPINPKAETELEFYRLGQCLLWTIEKIRVGNYPSDTPLLFKIVTETGDYMPVTSVDDIVEVWNLYDAWWKMVENQPAESQLDIYKFDPLQGSIYFWD